jgi:hypothetical protein
VAREVMRMNKMGRSAQAPPHLVACTTWLHSLLDHTPGVFRGMISYSIALQTRVVCPEDWLMKTPEVLILEFVTQRYDFLSATESLGE